MELKDANEKRPRRKRKKNRFTKPEFEPNNLGKNNFVHNSFIIPFAKLRTKAVIEEGKKEDGSPNFVRYKPEVEYLNYVKVFNLEVSTSEVISLGLRAKELLLYVIYNLRIAQDFVVIDRKLYMELHKIKTEPTYLGAVKELVKLGFIAPTADIRDVFWINPFYFFSGSRLKKFPGNKILYSEIIDQQDRDDELKFEEE